MTVPNLSPLAAAIRQMIWAEIHHASVPSLEQAAMAVDREACNLIAVCINQAAHDSADPVT